MRRLTAIALGAALAIAPAGVFTAGATAAAGGSTAHAVRAASWPTVRKGARGETVRTIQYLLTARGFREPVDGIYGKDTTATVKRFQKANKLSQDGSVGPKTWPKLIVTVKQGSRGSAVRAVQSQLRNRFGYKSVAVDGVFGKATAAAVKNFQSKKKLKVDGIVGSATWMALVR